MVSDNNRGGSYSMGIEIAHLNRATLPHWRPDNSGAERTLHFKQQWLCEITGRVKSRRWRGGSGSGSAHARWSNRTRRASNARRGGNLDKRDWQISVSRGTQAIRG